MSSFVKPAIFQRMTSTDDIVQFTQLTYPVEEQRWIESVLASMKLTTA